MGGNSRTQTRTVSYDWARIEREFQRSPLQRWARLFARRFFRAGETPQVFLACVWAMVSVAYPDSLAASYLAVYLPREAWAVLFSTVAVIHAVLLVHGCLLPRAIMAFAHSVLWGFAASIVIHRTPGGSALGPTLAVVTAGCIVTTYRLLRLRREWPL